MVCRRLPEEKLKPRLGAQQTGEGQRPAQLRGLADLLVLRQDALTDAVLGALGREQRRDIRVVRSLEDNAKLCL